MATSQVMPDFIPDEEINQYDSSPDFLSDEDMKALEAAQIPKPKGALEKLGDVALDFGEAAEEDLPGLGMMAGGTAGLMLGGPPGAVIGAGAGGFAGKAAQNLERFARGDSRAPKTNLEYLTEPANAATAGMLFERGGQKVAEVAGPYISEGIEKAKPYVKPVYDKIKGKLGNAADWMARKTGKTIHGMPEDFTQRYLDKEGNLVARPKEEIVDELASTEARLGEDVQNARESFRTRSQEVKDQIADQKWNAKNAKTKADLDYQMESRAREQALKQVTPDELAYQVPRALDKLKERVTEGSLEGYRILENTRGRVDIEPVRQKLREGIASLSQLTGEAITQTDEMAIRNLTELLEKLEKVQGPISYADAKWILQRLDPDITFRTNAGQFLAIADAVKSEARGVLNGLINVPAYKNIMNRVAAETELLKKLSQTYGTPERAITRLRSLNDAGRGNIDVQDLTRLGELTEYNFKAPIEEYVTAKTTLSNPQRMQRIRESTPEYKTKTQAEKEVERLGSPSVRKAVRERIIRSKQAQDLRDAKAKHEPYKPFAGSSAEAKTTSLTGQRPYAAKRAFDELKEVTGKDYSQEITDRAILDAFERHSTQGSRKTVGGKAIGKVVGMLVGGAYGKATGGDHDNIAAAAGAALGATGGMVLDMYSGAVLRGLLNGQIAVSQGIKSLEGAFGKYAPGMARAAQRGPQALADYIYSVSEEKDFQKKLEK